MHIKKVNRICKFQTFCLLESWFPFLSAAMCTMKVHLDDILRCENAISQKSAD